MTNDTADAPRRRDSNRLPRLLKRSEFLAAAKGRRVHSSRMTVQIYARTPPPTGNATAGDSAGSGDSVLPPEPVLPQKPAGGSPLIRGPRFGLTVTKKTANAVGRNRIRRRLRAILQDLRPFWPAADVDFVIVGRAELLSAPMDIIASDLKRAFSSPPRQGNAPGKTRISGKGKVSDRGKDSGGKNSGGKNSGGENSGGDSPDTSDRPSYRRRGRDTSGQNGIIQRNATDQS